MQQSAKCGYELTKMRQKDAHFFMEKQKRRKNDKYGQNTDTAFMRVQPTVLVENMATFLYQVLQPGCGFVT